nr:RHS repeat-associated core domain-containing protein [Oscillospiraceae bacterium]
NPFSFTLNGTPYFYVTNLQGDVTAIVNLSGDNEAIYNYDAFGKITSMNYTTVSQTNPLRYRGYYFDSELGFYYLQSRYYDPAICRFINSDSFASTGQSFVGYNMFVYCLNNPINARDDSGTLANWIVGGFIGGIIGGISSAAQGGSFWEGAAQGAVSGAIAGAAVDVALATVATGGIAGIAVGGAIAFVGGFGGNIAGEEVNSVITTGRGKKIDHQMVIRSSIAGAFNVVSFGLSASLKYSEEGIDSFNRSSNIGDITKASIKNLGDYSVGTLDAISSYFTTHLSIAAAGFMTN